MITLLILVVHIRYRTSSVQSSILSAQWYEYNVGAIHVSESVLFELSSSELISNLFANIIYVFGEDRIYIALAGVGGQFGALTCGGVDTRVVF